MTYQFDQRGVKWAHHQHRCDCRAARPWWCSCSPHRASLPSCSPGTDRPLSPSSWSPWSSRQRLLVPANHIVSMINVGTKFKDLFTPLVYQNGAKTFCEIMKALFKNVEKLILLQRKLSYLSLNCYDVNHSRYAKWYQQSAGKAREWVNIDDVYSPQSNTCSWSVFVKYILK